MAREVTVRDEMPLERFACPNPECDAFNQFGQDNLSVAERMGKNKAIRRLYCHCCQHRFSERQGSLMQYTKLSRDTVVRIVKCLTHGCSIAATADICQIDARSVQRLLERAGPRAEDFHQLQLDRLAQPPQAVELDELHAKVSRPPRGKPLQGKPSRGKKGDRPLLPSGLLASIGHWVATGFTRPWRSPRDF